MFPQGHGDAYGHYLTALKGYYRLLTNANFTWMPRTEAVLVLGQTVAVDYQDERKFAAAAADLARTAEQIARPSRYRQQLPATTRRPAGSTSATARLNTQSNVRRQWGLDEWASRAAPGRLLNWVMGNAMLPPRISIPPTPGSRKSTAPPCRNSAAARRRGGVVPDHPRQCQRPPQPARA